MEAATPLPDFRELEMRPQLRRPTGAAEAGAISLNWTDAPNSLRGPGGIGAKPSKIVARPQKTFKLFVKNVLASFVDERSGRPDDRTVGLCPGSEQLRNSTKNPRGHLMTLSGPLLERPINSTDDRSVLHRPFLPHFARGCARVARASTLRPPAISTTRRAAMVFTCSLPIDSGNAEPWTAVLRRFAIAWQRLCAINLRRRRLRDRNCNVWSLGWPTLASTRCCSREPRLPLLTGRYPCVTTRRA